MVAPATRSVIVDASVAAKWYLTDEEFADQAIALLTQFAAGAAVLFAPGHIRYEVPATIYKAAHGRTPRIDKGEALRHAERFLQLDLTIVDSSALLLLAFDLSDQYGCAFYDGVYIALSQSYQIPFITADAKLYRLIKPLPDVIWLADY